jgi:hypothetical protein
MASLAKVQNENYHLQLELKMARMAFGDVEAEKNELDIALHEKERKLQVRDTAPSTGDQPSRCGAALSPR